MIDTETLLDLAPADLPNLRPLRFEGAVLEVPLQRFAPADRDSLRHIYAQVDGLARLARAMGAQPDWSALESSAATLVRAGMIDRVQALGAATGAAGLDDPSTRKALHDIRGGGLTVLLGTAELLALAPGDEKLVRTCVAAARDHAKIMRCLLPDLDPPSRAADEATKAHNIGHFVDKWHGARLRAPSGPVVVSVRCDFRGDISARCLETASIDRVVYNLMNNSARFATGGVAQLAVQSVARGLTRWAVGNRVAAAEAAFLRDINLQTLFAGGVTRGGNGIGLASCAEVVAECFGLAQSNLAVQRGYVGAALRSDTFLVWFHWPAYAPADTAPGSV